jgi:hypothetical protein
MTRDDWPAAESMLAAAEQRFGGNPWTRGILAAMRRLIARRDGGMAAKEAAYASRSLRRRLASRDEGSFHAVREEDIPMYLRRKTEQGKGRRR